VRQELEEYRIRAGDGVEVTLHRLRGASGGGGSPVLLAAGTFSSRQFWVGSRAQGFAVRLAEAGYDPWILEPRGQGASDRPRSWTMGDWIRLDAPAAVRTVLEVTGRERILWVGHSAGGVVGAAYVGAAGAGGGGVGALVLLGSPGPGSMGRVRRIGAMAAMAAAGVLPHLHLPGAILGLGPGREPGTLIREWMRWNVTGRWDDGAGGDYLERLRRVHVPVLAVAGTGDRLLAPPAAVQDLLNRFGSADRTLIVAGRAHGYSENFDHPGLVIGRTARAEIWPRLIEWMDQRVQRPDDPPPPAEPQ
jgi:predicted alpha/beta hydrolase